MPPFPLQREDLSILSTLRSRGLLDDLAVAADADAIEALIDAQPESEQATCRHCSQRITRWQRGKWRHVADRMQACPSAAFLRDRDANVPSNWKAAPVEREDSNA